MRYSGQNFEDAFVLHQRHTQSHGRPVGHIVRRGGLPNPISFPQEALKESACRIIDEFHGKVFQYSTTNGYAPPPPSTLRTNTTETSASASSLSTSSSRPARSRRSDLIAKILLNKGDGVIMRRARLPRARYRPSMMFEPEFYPVTPRTRRAQARRARSGAQEGR